MNTLVIQYIVIGALLLFACFRVWKIFSKNFSKKKAVVATKTADVHKSCP
jgi:F0F1-type ATP synthase membrane subunit b/b'